MVCSFLGERCQALESSVPRSHPKYATSDSLSGDGTGNDSKRTADEPAETTWNLLWIPGQQQTPITAATSAKPVYDADGDEERFSVLHLRLLRHFEHDLYRHTKALHPGLREALSLFVDSAFAAPYLMDELLGYAAAHKSTLLAVGDGKEGIEADQAQRQLHLDEAAKLQTRALELYNHICPDLSVETCAPMFIFSSLLSHHVIFDVQRDSHSGSLSKVINGLTHSIGIHRGLLSIAKMAWPFFDEETRILLEKSCRRDCEPVPVSKQMSPDLTRRECDSLQRRLEASNDIPSSARTTLCEAVELLQDKLDTMSANDSHSLWAAVQDWLAGLPAGYVPLLHQRRPEALVVLAHFGVLLHRAAEHWFVGDLGVRVVRLVVDHLGAYWDSWLEWPVRVTTSSG